MILVEAFNIEKHFGERLIFRIPELRIYAGDKIGIVGANGAGKTTLMNILSGKMAPDSGRCVRHGQSAYIQQFSDETSVAKGRILGEFALKGKTNRENLSGGEHTRVKITNALSHETGLLFADEPTSNLDYKGVGLLAEKLSKVETLVIISHDRGLLDNLCNKIIEVKDGAIAEYTGNYSDYLEQSQAAFDRASAEYEQYKAEKARLQQTYQQKQSKAKAMTKRPKGMSGSEYKMRTFTASKSFDVKQKNMERAAKAVQSRIDQMEVKEKPKEIPKIKLDFLLTDPPHNKIIMSAKDLSFRYGSNVIFEGAAFEIKNNSKTAIVGDNGAGKTTLMYLMSRNNSVIYKVPKAKPGYFYQDFGNLDFNKTVLENVMSTSVQDQTVARTMLARLLFGAEEVHKPAGVLSGGEKIKLALAKLLTSDANILLLDEPTNYLDIGSIEAVQELLSEYEGTLVFVSHDKVFVDAIADHLLLIDNKKIKTFAGNLSAYENRQIKKEDDSAQRLLEEIRKLKELGD